LITKLFIIRHALTWYQIKIRAYPNELSWIFCFTQYRVAKRTTH